MSSSPARITIDCRWMLREPSGIGVYTRHLVQALISLDGGKQYQLLFHDPAVARKEVADMTASTTPPQLWQVPWGPFSLGGQLLLPRRLRRNTEIYHSPNYLIPYAAFPRNRRGPVGCVITIHDVIPLKFPDHAPRARKSRVLWLYRWLVREAIRRADTVIVPSRATRNDIVSLFHLTPSPNGKIEIIPEAVSPLFHPARHRRSPDPLVLFVGRRDPYKNLPLLIEAFARLHQRLPRARLEIVGPPDPRYPEPEQKAEKLGLRPFITWTGYLAEEDLARAYQRAHLLVLPSRYEGFGLPVLEAMASGCPVVCSRAGSLPEIAGEAALYVEPLEADTLAQAMYEVLRRPDLAARLADAGLARAASYSWENTARRTIAVYRHLREDGGRRT